MGLDSPVPVDAVRNVTCPGLRRGESLQKLVRANVNDLLTSYDVALIVAIAIHDNCAKYSDKMQSYIDTAHITG
jgi:hypothetical protein